MRLSKRKRRTTSTGKQLPEVRQEIWYISCPPNGEVGYRTAYLDSVIPVCSDPETDEKLYQCFDTLSGQRLLLTNMEMHPTLQEAEAAYGIR